MPIKPICDRCKKELNEFGAILFGPPNERNEVKKFHLCKKCYQEIVDSFGLTSKKPENHDPGFQNRGKN